MGQALDGDGNVLGETTGATKKEVFEKLDRAHPEAEEIRVMTRRPTEHEENLRRLTERNGIPVDQLPPHTKLNPGEYDCYRKLALDEPYFILRAKDPQAPALVEAWANIRSCTPGNETNPKIGEARQVAHEMREWRKKHVPA